MDDTPLKLLELQEASDDRVIMLGGHKILRARPLVRGVHSGLTPLASPEKGGINSSNILSRDFRPLAIVFSKDLPL